jgi:hypothetical protein
MLRITDGLIVFNEVRRKYMLVRIAGIKLNKIKYGKNDKEEGNEEGSDACLDFLSQNKE